MEQNKKLAELNSDLAEAKRLYDALNESTQYIKERVSEEDYHEYYRKTSPIHTYHLHKMWMLKTQIESIRKAQIIDEIVNGGPSGQKDTVQDKDRVVGYPHSHIWKEECNG